VSGHTMQVRQEGDTVVLRPVCHEPEGAICRIDCTQGCEAWDVPHEHPMKNLDYCSAVEWLTADGWASEYYDEDADDIPLHDGMPIEVVWEGEFYVWRAVKGSPDPTESTAGDS
jgi:hypothetical protein